MDSANAECRLGVSIKLLITPSSAPGLPAHLAPLRVSLVAFDPRGLHPSARDYRGRGFMPTISQFFGIVIQMF